MPKATVKITDKKNKVIFEKTWETADVSKAAHKFSSMYPDCWVNVTADENNFSALSPMNMHRDERLVEEGLLSFNKYVTRWYGKQVAKKTVEQELIKEFGEEDMV
jgi:hypothetical protein